MNWLKKRNLAELIILLNGLLLAVSQLLIYAKSVSSYLINKWIGLPQQFDNFASKPWTIVSYAFFHTGLQHLFWNMFCLFFVGRIFFNLFDQRHFVKVYFLGIIIGGISFLLISDFLPVFFDDSILLGASGAILALLGFMCVIVPNYTIYLFYAFKTKLWVITFLWFLVDMLQISQSNSGGRIVHLSGFFTGVVIALSLKYRLRFHKKPFEKLTKKSKLRNNINPLKSNVTTTNSQKIRQHKVNIILEKINSSGYTSLTDEEKKFLFQISKEGDKNHKDE